jgi:uncharacterized protein (TIGR02996 family)
MSRTSSEARRIVARSLVAANAAFVGGDTRSVAEQLREAWRASRDPELASLHEVLVTAQADALPGRNSSERALAWRELATLAPGDPMLLAGLLDEPAYVGSSEPPHVDTSELERLGLLSAWTPDPLLASALASRLRLPVVPVRRVQPGDERIAIETARLLASQRDPRALEWLEQIARQPGASAWERRQLRAAIADLKAVTSSRIDPDARAVLLPIERRAAELRAREARSAALLEAIYADPDADAPRIVYADWLASLGQPRGEFISLQLARQPSDPASERERGLLARHGDEWTGPLHAVTNPLGRVFERGFLTSVSIEAPLDPERITAPEWTTLRSLDGHVSDLLALRGRLDRLRTLYGFLDLRRFIELRAMGRLESVEHYECSLADPNLRFDTPLGLRSLLVRRAFDEQLIELLDSPACEGLETFAVYYDGSSLGGPAWTGDHRERPGLRTRAELLRGRLPSHVHTLCMLDGQTSRATAPEGCTLRLHRDPDGGLTRLVLDVHAKHGSARRAIAAPAIVTLLEGLPLHSLSLVTLGDVDETVCERATLHAALRAAGVRVAA